MKSRNDDECQISLAYIERDLRHARKPVFNRLEKWTILLLVVTLIALGVLVRIGAL